MQGSHESKRKGKGKRRPDTSTPVDPSQRHSAEKPCPVCFGWQGGPTNCYGYVASSVPIVYCTVEGNTATPRNETAEGQPWIHKARGVCLCGKTHAPEGGLTLEEFQKAKFPTFTVRDLERKGLWQANYGVDHAPAVFFAYVDGDLGDVFQPYRTRIRVALTENADGKKFFWKREPQQKKPLVPYMLDQLAEARRLGRIIIAEGETCTLTCVLHDFCATGLPGAGVWSEAWAEQYYAGIDTIFIIVEQNDGEPDKGAEKIFHWLSKSSIRHRAHLVRCETFKDVNALYLDDPARFKARFEACLRQAQPWAEFEKSYAALHRKAHFEQCKDLLQEQNLLDRLASDAHKRGLVREDRAVKLLYLIRQTVEIADEENQACSGVLKAQSSAGKNQVLKHALAFVPEDAISASTLMSPRNLFYTEGGPDEYAHRTLVLYEAAAMSDNDLLAYVIRTLISEGRLKLDTVIDHKAQTLDKNGPTNFITTTTRINLDAELETRLFPIPIDETDEQTQQISEGHSKRWAGVKRQEVNLEPWHAFHRWLQSGNKRVVIPFEKLGSALPVAALRLRRDWPGVLMLTATHAWLHQAHRKVDTESRIIAEWQDYTAVHALVDDLIAEAVNLKISEPIRNTVLAASQLYEQQPKGEFGFRRGVQIEQIAAALKVHPSTASRNVAKAIDKGFLFNEETRPSQPARIKPTSLQMPKDQKSILPRRLPVTDNDRNRATPPETPETPNDSDGLTIAADSAIVAATGVD